MYKYQTLKRSAFIALLLFTTFSFFESESLARSSKEPVYQENCTEETPCIDDQGNEYWDEGHADGSFTRHSYENGEIVTTYYYVSPFGDMGTSSDVSTETTYTGSSNPTSGGDTGNDVTMTALQDCYDQAEAMGDYYRSKNIPESEVKKLVKLAREICDQEFGEDETPCDEAVTSKTESTAEDIIAMASAIDTVGITKLVTEMGVTRLHPALALIMMYEPLTDEEIASMQEAWANDPAWQWVTQSTAGMSDIPVGTIGRAITDATDEAIDNGTIDGWNPRYGDYLAQQLGYPSIDDLPSDEYAIVDNWKRANGFTDEESILDDWLKEQDRAQQLEEDGFYYDEELDKFFNREGVEVDEFGFPIEEQCDDDFVE